MNYRLVLRLIGNILKIEAMLMAFPLAVSLLYKNSYRTIAAFAAPMLILLAAGFALGSAKPKSMQFRARDAFAAASLAWMAMSFFGALPFYFSGGFASFIDCIFESVSGFTSTGISILVYTENLPESILFWRSFAHWTGGIGVLVFMLAATPEANASGVNLLKAESTGLSPDKIVPKVRQSAKILCLIYLSMSAALFVMLIASGMPLFDCIINTASVAATGGLSNKDIGIGAYGNAAAEMVIALFMFLFGVNFTIYYYIVNKKIKQALADEELRVYVAIVIVSIAVIAIDISSIYGSVPSGLRYAIFQVTSMVSSTGMVTADFESWPALSRALLFIFMFTGACAGSTSGGAKMVRFIVLYKAAKAELRKIIHPGSEQPIALNGRKVSSDIISKASLFLFCYFFLFIVSVLLVSIEGADILTSSSAVIASLSNSGPGLNAVGAYKNYSKLSALSKSVLSFCMIAGRLEIIPVLILFKPSIWKRGGMD